MNIYFRDYKTLKPLKDIESTFVPKEGDYIRFVIEGKMELFKVARVVWNLYGKHILPNDTEGYEVWAIVCPVKSPWWSKLLQTFYEYTQSFGERERVRNE